MTRALRLAPALAALLCVMVLWPTLALGLLCLGGLAIGRMPRDSDPLPGACPDTPRTCGVSTECARVGRCGQPDDRAAPRIQPVEDTLAAVLWHSGQAHPAEIIDLSTTGIRLRLRADTPLRGTELALGITLGSAPPLLVPATARWQEHNDTHLFLGAAFVQAAPGYPALRSQIAAWVHAACALRAAG